MKTEKEIRLRLRQLRELIPSKLGYEYKMTYITALEWVLNHER